MSTGKILIIDDEKLIVKATSLVLSLSGYDVTSAYNGEEGLNMAHESKPDLILLDIMMPGMDGWQVLERLKNNPETKTIPVIVFTAKEYLSGKLKSHNAGASDFVAKPFETPELIEIIEKHLSISDKGGDLS
jgi:CheY-like chemotaxis protein